jgi:hypothetical protein
VKKTFLLILLLLLACTPKLNSMPELSQEELNSKIALKESLGLQDIYNAIGTIDLYLENLSDSPVSFPSNFNAEIYVQQDKNWKKVDNIYGYPTGDNVLPTAKEYPAGLVVPVKPDLSQITVRPIILRITVTGVLQNSGKKVGSYIDITIK